MRKALTTALAVSLALTPGLACKSDTAPIAKIDSGDSVLVVSAKRGHEVVLEKDGERAVVRLVGIYSFPISVMEKNDISVHAKLSKGFVERELKGQSVTLVLEREEPDPRGRYLGYLEEEGRDFNLRLLETGHAVLYTEFPFSRELAYAKADAEARKWVRGMWGGTSAKKRVGALRKTWSAVRVSETGVPVIDPLLQE